MWRTRGRKAETNKSVSRTMLPSATPVGSLIGWFRTLERNVLSPLRGQCWNDLYEQIHQLPIYLTAA
jgi:hypothetical protein